MNIAVPLGNLNFYHPKQSAIFPLQSPIPRRACVSQRLYWLGAAPHHFVEGKRQKEKGKSMKSLALSHTISFTSDSNWDKT